MVLEGIDGAGTTTQARILMERLFSEGHRAHLTREPSDGPIGVLIRQVLTGRVVARPGDGPPEPVDGASVALLFAADRVDHLRSEIEPLIDRGVHVISDRYVLSSLAYQSLDNDLAWVQGINARARVPDLTVFLDVSPKAALLRREASREAEERFDALALQRRVARSYRKLVREGEGLGRVVTLDGSKRRERIAEAVWAEVAGLVGARG